MVEVKVDPNIRILLAMGMQSTPAECAGFSGSWAPTCERRAESQLNTGVETNTVVLVSLNHPKARFDLAGLLV